MVSLFHSHYMHEQFHKLFTAAIQFFFPNFGGHFRFFFLIALQICRRIRFVGIVDLLTKQIFRKIGTVKRVGIVDQVDLSTKQIFVGKADLSTKKICRQGRFSGKVELQKRLICG